jgi:hypothetical protein
MLVGLANSYKPTLLERLWPLLLLGAALLFIWKQKFMS